MAAAAEIVQLKSHIGELEGKLQKAYAGEAEATKLQARIAELERATNELASFKKRWVEHEGKLKLVDEENGRLKARLAEFEALHNEVQTLRLRVTSLEPQVSEWETRYSTTVAQKDAELSQCRSKVADLEQHVKPAAVHHHVPTKAERDDLKKIYGIGPVLEKRLNDLGVYFFREIAMWSKEDILRYEEHLKEFRDRIERDNWVEGAREEHFKKYGERLLKADSASA
jgi:predicted flap endonuclease-1-like 5' DNA nuclease